ncbi:response regulator receiver protein [Haliangium ochraceum DSM 14365]|uniref:Response regulator receiver protein n=2 Tax=Haliangium ochraceum TaxID=80816 RepID=D0LU77_HALO1|nr:response regulator receiver protein [Haliangium ochraceum DSM 14365]
MDRFTVLMPPRILVADDDAWILRMVTTVLKKRGYEVDTAPDGEQAYERALSNPPDLLITDVMMPNVDGWTLVKQMREHPSLCDVPVIFLTALSADDDRIHGFRLGADDYLPKPFRFEELDLRVARTLRRTRNNAPPPSPPKVAPPKRLPTPTPVPGGDSDDEAGLETALSGDLGEIGLPMLLTMLEMEQKSGILELTHETEGVAELYLRSGRVVHATLDYTPGGDEIAAAGDDDEVEIDELSWGLEDAECVYYLLKWTEGRFEFKPGEVSTEDRVGASITQLLMEGARRLDELNENSRRMEEIADVDQLEENASAVD